MEFADVRIDLDTRELWRGGEKVAVEPQVFDVLVHLLTHRDRVVPKTELLDEVWGDRFVAESTLTSRIKSVRAAIGDSGRKQQYIRTVHGRGYHFVADVVDPQVTTTALPSSSSELLDRDAETEALTQALRDASAGSGRIVLVAGEPGIGKSCLVTTWAGGLEQGRARVLLGWCDDLLTSRPLGPFHDVARESAPELRAPVATGDTGDLLEGLLTLLAETVQPVVLVLEDVHWADGATLDVIRYLGRRIERLRAVMVLTYRDSAVDARHPLGSVLGTLAGAPTIRVYPAPLGESAIQELTAGTDVDPAAVLQVTGGNPFFVREVLRDPQAELPASVNDAVLGRLRGMNAATQEAVTRLSVVPGALELTVARRLVPDDEVLATAERRGLVAVGRGAVRFRHELARRAVEDHMTAAERLAANRAVLQAMLEDAAPDADALLHHAVAAGDVAAIVEHGPDAARAAVRAGAHVGAVEKLGHVLEHADRLSVDEHAELLAQRAWSLHHLHRFAEAVDSAVRCVALREEQGDVDELVAALTMLTTMHFMAGEVPAGMAVFARATDLLPQVTRLDVRSEYYLVEVTIHHVRGEHATVLARAPAIIAAATAVGRGDLALVARTYLCASQVIVGHVEAIDDLAAALDDADPHAHPTAVARAHLRLVDNLMRLRRWEQGKERIAAAVDFHEDHDYRIHRFKALSHLARCHVELGEWEQAEDVLTGLEAEVEHAGVTRVFAQHAAALLAMRTGRPDAGDVLRRAWDFAVGTETDVNTLWVGPAVLEWAWLRGDTDLAAEVADGLLTAAEGTILHGEVLWHVALNGLEAAPPEHFLLDGPEVASLRGDVTAAAEGWAAMGMRYRQALELATGGGPDDRRRARAIIDDIGARGALDAVTR